MLITTNMLIMTGTSVLYASSNLFDGPVPYVCCNDDRKYLILLLYSVTILEPEGSEDAQAEDHSTKDSDVTKPELV